MACATEDKGRAYLPMVGPSPLRFKSVPDRTNTFVQLPLPESAKADSVPASPSSEQTEEVNPFALSEMLAPAADRDTNAVIMRASSPPPIPAAPVIDQQPISPQVFLQYFPGFTNLPSANPASPVDFTPPRAQAPGRPSITPSP
jgi:hypothetical protein